MTDHPFANLLHDIRACQHCSADLPLGPRPIIRGTPKSKILIIGQAPGTKVHETGIPWNDPSGERLRDWMQLTPNDFYNEDNLAIMPMGLCYPGRLPKGGDCPPRPECAPLWHEKFKAHLTEIKLTLLVGSYAQKYYLGKSAKKNMTETIRAYQDYADQNILPLPHPSWRTRHWQTKNPWFKEEVLPILRHKLEVILKSK